MYYRHLITLLKMFCLFKDRLNVWVDVYAVIIIVVLLVYVIFCLSEIRVFYTVSNINLILDYLMHFTASLTVIVGIIYCSFHKKKMFIRLNDKLQKLCEILKVEKLDFSGKFLFIHAYFFILLFMNYFSSVYFKYILFLEANFCFYSLTLMVLQYYCVLNYIFLCCRKLRMKVVNLMDGVVNNKTTFWQVVKKTTTLCKDTRNILEWYNQITSIIFLVNQIYGVQFLFFFTYILIFSTSAIQQSIMFGIFFEGKHSQRGYPEITLTLVRAITYFIFGVIITNCCNKITIELKNIALEGYNLLIKLPYKLQSKEYKKIYDNIILFEYLVHKKNYISGGNFFNIDRSLLFTMVGTITSYLIIFLGFEKELIRWIRTKIAKSNSTYMEFAMK